MASDTDISRALLRFLWMLFDLQLQDAIIKFSCRRWSMCLQLKCLLSERSQKAIFYCFGKRCVSILQLLLCLNHVSSDTCQRCLLLLGQKMVGLCLQQEPKKCHTNSPASSQAKVMVQVSMPHETNLFRHRPKRSSASHGLDTADA